MVARGDLGVEAGNEKVPLIQKQILHDIKFRAKPAITATQMLDSMIKNPRPTRAEVSDVANAVLDGTGRGHAVSRDLGGDYPVEAVKTLARIIDEIEGSEYYHKYWKERPDVTERTYSSSIADAAAEIAEDLKLAAIAVYTESGHSAALLPRSARWPTSWRSRDTIPSAPAGPVLGRVPTVWGLGQGRRWRGRAG